MDTNEYTIECLEYVYIIVLHRIKYVIYTYICIYIHITIYICIYNQLNWNPPSLRQVCWCPMRLASTWPILWAPAWPGRHALARWSLVFRTRSDVMGSMATGGCTNELLGQVDDNWIRHCNMIWCFNSCLIVVSILNWIRYSVNAEVYGIKM